MSLKDRVSNIQKNIKGESKAILISSVYDIMYLTGYSNFSLEEKEAFLFITVGKKYIITDGRYKEAVEKHIPHFTLLELSTNLGFEKALLELSLKHKIEILEIEENSLTFKEYKIVKKIFKKLAEFKSDTLRIIKDVSEIKKIEKACKLNDNAFSYILTRLKPGVSEKEIAKEIEIYYLSHRAEKSFSPVVAFGANSSFPHHKPTDKKLKNNEIVLIDMGTRLNDYCSDMTRVVFLGKASEKQKEVYKIVLEAQEKTIKKIKENITASDIDKTARQYILSKNYPPIPHSLGHGIGLEVHENPKISPSAKTILKQNMVFSIEPGIYLPGEFGIRIEDLVVLEKNGPKILTNSSKTLLEI